MTEKSDTIPEAHLRTCEIQRENFEMATFVMVIFGGAGDLSRRMLMPTLFHIHQEGLFLPNSAVIGAGLPEMSDEQYRDSMKESVREFAVDTFSEEDWGKFEGRLSFISGDFDSDETYEHLLERIEALGSRLSGDQSYNVIYYLAVPPIALDSIVTNLDNLDLCKASSRRFKTRIIIEKPFGHDRLSAIKLNQLLLGAFDENQIYRMDYFLGKETMQNILFFRFSNSIFEHLWNSRFIDNVQITVSETIGIGTRGQFYEQTGIVRDMLQNHVLQILGLISMEPPVGFGADYIRDEKVKLFRSIRNFEAGSVDEFAVRGQYDAGAIRGAKVAGYRQEADVSAESSTPTFFAGKLFIDNWRWAGVPFYIRTGKRMAEFLTEVSIEFRRPPLKLFGGTPESLEPNALYLTLEPEERVSLRFGVKYPFSANQIYPAELAFSYQDTFDLRRHPPYEKLLVDSLKGDPTLFVRQDGVEAMWEVVDPLIERWEGTAPADFPNYAAGSWGPQAAHRLLERDGRRWHVL